MHNLHLSLTEFRNETRVLKQTNSLIESDTIDSVDIVALHSEGLKEYEELGKGSNLYRLKLRSRKLPKNWVFQIVKYFEYSWNAVMLSRSKKPGIVTIHSLGLLPVGIGIRYLLDYKLVYDAHELETETYVLHGVRKRISKIVENLFIRKVDLVVVVSGSIADWYRNNYQINNVITVLNSPLVKEVVRTNLLHDALSIPNKKKILIYLGGLIRGRGIEELLSTFRDMPDSQYVIVFMGYGHLSSLIEEHSSKFNNIYLMPAVMPEQVLEYTASADAGVAFIDNGSLNDEFCLPNKLFECIFSGIPVVVNNAPEMAKLVQEFDIGVVIDKMNVTELSLALKRIEEMNIDVLSKNLESAKAKLSWEVQEKILLSGYRAYADL